MVLLLLNPEQIDNQNILCVSILPIVSSIACVQTIQEYSPRGLHRLMSSFEIVFPATSTRPLN
jgi:hypothetical protein